MSSEKFIPTEMNLGKNCSFWQSGQQVDGCAYPDAKMQGRMSCEGVIDDVCLFLRTGRQPSSITTEQITELRTRRPSRESNRNIPPGKPV